MTISEEFSTSCNSVQVIVIGDLILDHYIEGTSERVSPEAPVPVVRVRSQRHIAGGAANVARNLAAAGCRVVCAGVIGNDESGATIIAELNAIAVETSAITTDPSRETTRKTRIVASNQQIVRLDAESNAEISSDTAAALLSAIKPHLPRCGAVILSDYAKGVLTNELCQSIIALAATHDVPVFVDPKGRHYGKYRNCYALTPNAREAAELAGLPVDSEANLRAAAAAIRAECACRNVLITRGPEGYALFPEGAPDPIVQPTNAREVFDVTGAGDTFIAWLSLGVAAGLALADSAALANAAAGVAVGKAGCAAVTFAELRATIATDAASRKIVPRHELPALARNLREANHVVVFTNGCFDFIHAGHVDLLHRARALGNILILATNSDEAIARLKGPGRPVVRAEQRLRLLAAIEAVDHIVVFDDDKPHQLLDELRPDILVKGGNYGPGQVEGEELVRGYGGKVVRLDVLEGISTTELVAAHQNRPRPEAAP